MVHFSLPEPGAVLGAAHQRFAAAFTGLARAGDFSTEAWLLKALSEALGASNHRIGHGLDLLADMATAKIKELEMDPQLRLDPVSKRLTIAFVGYHYAESPPRVYALLVSNFEAFGERARAEASEAFTVTWMRDRRPPTSGTPTLVKTVGAEGGVDQAALQAISELLEKRAPADAVRDKCVAVLRDAADARASQDVIGKQATSVILPADHAADASAAYHSIYPAPQTYIPNLVASTSDSTMVFWGMSFGAFDDAGNPVAQVPRVRRDARCPCGSGKKFKRCHGSSTGGGGMTVRIGPQ